MSFIIKRYTSLRLHLYTVMTFEWRGCPTGFDLSKKQWVVLPLPLPPFSSPLFFPLLARYVGLAGSGLGEGVKANPQTKIFSHQCGGHLQPVGG